MDQPDRLQDAGDPERGELAGEDRLGPRGRDIRLCGKIIDLVGPGVLEHYRERMLVEEIGSYDLDPVEEMVDPFIAVMAGTPHDTHDLVALGEEELRQIGPVLTGDPGDERFRQGGPPCKVVSSGCPR
jgi:hypothetical protein